MIARSKAEHSNVSETASNWQTTSLTKSRGLLGAWVLHAVKTFNGTCVCNMCVCLRRTIVCLCRMCVVRPVRLRYVGEIGCRFSERGNPIRKFKFGITLDISIFIWSYFQFKKEDIITVLALKFPAQVTVCQNISCSYCLWKSECAADRTKLRPTSWTKEIIFLW